MGIEIERKFLVKDDTWRDGVEGRAMMQGYVCVEGHTTVRTRISGSTAWLTIKGATQGSTRPEFEFEIPVHDAQEMLRQFAGERVIEKTRYRIPIGAHVWEVDVFAGQNAPLIVAEIELGSEDEAFDKPAWLGQEVTTDNRYFNAYLSEHPYSTWAT